LFTPIKIGDKEYRLRFPAKTLISMERLAGEQLFNTKNRVSVIDLLNNLFSIEVQIYLLQKGLEWEHPDITFEKAAELWEEYFNTGEPDDGTRNMSLIETLAAALNASIGIDLKKTKSTTKEKARSGHGGKPPDSA